MLHTGRLIAIGSALATTLVCGAALGQAVERPGLQPPPRFQLVGFSSAMLRGGAGVLGFTRACQTDLPDSRMCTSEEVMDTVRLPDLPVEAVAWVRPVLHGAATAESRDGQTGAVVVRSIPYDSSGINAGAETLAEESSCHGWAQGSTGHGGLTVSSNGSFDVEACATERPVACCALVR